MFILRLPCFMLGAILGMILFMNLSCLVAYILGKAFDYFLLYIRFLGRSARRRVKSEELAWKKEDFTLLTTLITGYMVGTKDEKSRRTYLITNYVVLGAITFTPAIYILITYMHDKSLLSYFLNGMAIALVFFMAYGIIYSIRGNNTFDKNLQAVLETKMLRIMDGANFEQIDIPLEPLKLRGRNKLIRTNYLVLLSNKALWMKDYQGLNNFVRDLDFTMRVNGARTQFSRNIMLLAGFYTILFYSSYIHVNKPNATMIYKHIKNDIETDWHPDAKRIRAYYSYYVLGRPAEASVFISQAREAIDRCNNETLPHAYRELERRLLDELESNMTRDLNQNTVMDRPIIENTYDD